MTTGGNRFIGKINAPPPISTPRQAPWQDIGDIQSGLAILSQQLAAIISLLGGQNPIQIIGGGGESNTVINQSGQTISLIIPNLPTFTSGSLSIATVTPHTPVQLLSQPVKDGYPVTIVANPANAGNIYLGKSQSEVDDLRKRFNGLAPGLAVQMKIQNTSAVWFDADNIGDGISWYFESDT